MKYKSLIFLFNVIPILIILTILALIEIVWILNLFLLEIIRLWTYVYLQLPLHWKNMGDLRRHLELSYNFYST